MRPYDVVTRVFFASAETFRVVLTFKREGIVVEVLGVNTTSATLVKQHAWHDKAGPAQAARHCTLKVRGSGPITFIL